ncbi:MAG TPA: type VI secretion system contractile sheath small subunit [Paracoccaceae bacterium]|nr:type VI secretion system contractile sheath small subunit [Paracoccaceae bacterium]
MADSGQKFIRRNRMPRVHIAYDDPYDAQKKIEIPFVMGVMADLSGNDAGVEKDEVADREFLEFDMDNFDERMSKIEPGLAFAVENKIGGEGDKLAVNLRFKKMDDFNPTAVARQVEPVAKLLEAREALANLGRYMDGKVAAEDKLKQLLNDPELMKALKEKREAAEAAAGNGDNA